jgi:hypothetical protein
VLQGGLIGYVAVNWGGLLFLARETRDTPLAFPKLHALAVYGLLGFLDCSLIVGTHHDLWRSRDVSFGINRIDAVMRHELPT